MKGGKSSEDRDLPSGMQGIAVLQKDAHLYNDIENHYQIGVGRESFMQNRSKIAAMTLVMCLSFLMSACSGTANTNPQASAKPSESAIAAQPSVSPSASPTQEAKSATRTVSTPKGDVVIPAEPQRVAADQYMGHLLKLGIVPIGVRTFMLGEGWLEKAGIDKEVLASIEDMGGFPMNLEKLVELEPDLILGSVEGNIEQYEKVGTTVFLPYWTGKSTADPLQKFRSISDIFGKREEAEAWIAEYGQRVAEARSKIAGIVKEGETVSVLQIGDKAVYVLAAVGGNYGSSTIYQMLQLPPTEIAKNMKEGFESISAESLPEYMGDHIFVYYGEPEATNRMFESELWKGLPAVKNDQVYLFGNEFHDEFVMEDPYSLDLQLDTIVNLMLAKKK
jgi:iron complex transport system substrate-binding protein